MIENIKLHLWGFVEIFFEAIDNIVYLRGTQYEICNKPIPNFIKFINENEDIQIYLNHIKDSIQLYKFYKYYDI